MSWILSLLFGLLELRFYCYLFSDLFGKLEKSLILSYVSYLFFLGCVHLLDLLSLWQCAGSGSMIEALSEILKLSISFVSVDAVVLG